MSGGWKWINIPYEEQLKIKEQQVKESLKIVEQKQSNLNFLPITSSPTID
jgi:tRNA/tmRNA/rRNA uracil-C5-methylase (TrmA/RlmC/RlmD family)